MDYEQLATSAVRASIAKTTNLLACINEGDKEPSWDGNIYLRKRGSKTKEDLHKIPVQIKGKGVERWNDQAIRYRISFVDLYNYLHDGGVIFFVVYINKVTGDTGKIYYSSLLPKKIEELIKGAKGNKSINVELKIFPQDEQEKENIFYFFIKHKNLQSVMLANSIDIRELEKEGMVDGFSFSFIGTGLNEEKIPHLMVEQKELYLYAKIKGANLLYPYEYCREISFAFLERNLNLPVCVHGKEYFSSYKVICSNTGNYLQFCQGIQMSLKISSDNVGKFLEPSINVKFDGSLRNRIIKLEFLLDLINYQEIEVAGVNIPIKVSEEEKISFNYEMLKEDLLQLNNFRKVLEELKIDKDLNVDELNKNDINNLIVLHRSIIEKKFIEGKYDNLPMVKKIKIGNLKLILIIENYLKDEKKYRIFNFFGHEISVRYNYKETVFYASQYAILEKNDFIELDNINYQNIIDEIKSIELSEGAIALINKLLLEMILAYDICGDNDLYNSMLNIAEWMVLLDDDCFDRAISEINRIQILKRKNDLTFLDKQILYEIIKSKEDELCCIAAFSLLEEQEEFNKRFTNLSNADQELYKKFPIYKFSI